MTMGDLARRLVGHAIKGMGTRESDDLGMVLLDDGMELLVAFDQRGGFIVRAIIRDPDGEA